MPKLLFTPETGHGFTKRNRKDGARRLRTLAAHLRTNVVRKEFDMGTVRNHTPCGTVACALGHAPSIPSFRKSGLSLKVNADVTQYDIEDGTLPEGSKVYDVVYGEKVDSQAARAFFYLTDEETCALFGWDGFEAYESIGLYNPTPKQVARQLENFADAMEAAA